MAQDVPVAPYLGEPVARARGCSYSRRPGEPRCGAKPVTHVWSRNWDNTDAGLFACAPHTGIARNVGRMVDEHPYGDACGHPRAEWQYRAGCCTVPAGGAA